MQKDLGLCYLPEISVILSSLSYSLSGLEFEHEQLAGLKLLAFLIEWKYENGIFPNPGLLFFFSILKVLCIVSHL